MEGIIRVPGCVDDTTWAIVVVVVVVIDVVLVSFSFPRYLFGTSGCE